MALRFVALLKNVSKRAAAATVVYSAGAAITYHDASMKSGKEALERFRTLGPGGFAEHRHCDASDCSPDYPLSDKSKDAEVIEYGTKQARGNNMAAGALWPAALAFRVIDSPRKLALKRFERDV
ncbi:MAG: hypothetical protein Hyperionvirus5_97 [Hyperionvirus sp.]|uniref:Uncharacterized protein n=1 Tax=Hyperionvirus sp. TaxID=2487770 RepID=A0A3G5AAP8_9VIRU|nr:MAG: hypothetical protein Hyperionvirus5_97 [Hyperionvirus sp.]